MKAVCGAIVPGAFLTAGVAWSQSGGSISGRVKRSDSGAPLGGVVLEIYTASNPSTPAASVATDGAGLYTASNLAPGSYRALTVNTQGSFDELFRGLRCQARL